MLNTYEKYSNFWDNNIKYYRSARDKLNVKGLKSKNYRFNQLQYLKGDPTLSERQEVLNE